MQLKSIYCIIRGQSYLNIDIKKKKSHAKPRQGNSKPLHRNDPHQGQKIKGNHFPLTSNRPPPSINHNRCSKCSDTAHQEGFTCQAKKYQCKVCHKFEHFTSQCFQKKQYPQQKYRQAHQIQVDESHHYAHGYSSDTSSSEDSFCLQVKVKKQKQEDPQNFQYHPPTHQHSLQIETAPHQKPLPVGTDRHWC